MGSRVAILVCVLLGAAFTSACSAKSEEVAALKPPATYSTQDFSTYQNPATGRWYCGPGEYDGHAVPVSGSNPEASAFGMRLKLEATGSQMVVSVHTEDAEGIAAFIVGDAEQSFLVTVPADKQHDSQFTFEAKDFIGATELNSATGCLVR